jgi:hypothetical protein
LRDHFPVARMDAIEIADRQRARAARFGRGQASEDFHLVWRLGEAHRSPAAVRLRRVACKTLNYKALQGDCGGADDRISA